MPDPCATTGSGAASAVQEALRELADEVVPPGGAAGRAADRRTRPREAGRAPAARRLNTDPETVERDLIKLVLTIVELLRQLMERTALHRVDQGDLTVEQEEQVGRTLLALEERMAELCDRYGLTMADLNLDLGPLGSLLPRD